MIRGLLSLAITGAVLSVSAQTQLFYTDFATTPEGIKMSSDSATAKGVDDTLFSVSLTDPAPKDTLIDGCTFTITNPGSAIVVSKNNQKPVQVGDFSDATNGRCGLKQTGCSITLPSVTGPCTITYHAAATSATAGKGVLVSINGTNVPEAGFTDLLLNGAQATRKMEYGTSIEGPVVFKLSGIGGIYLYDIKVVSGNNTKAIYSRSTIKGTSPSIKLNGLTILNSKKETVQIFNSAGEMVVSSNNSTINMQPLVQGMYVVRSIEGKSEFSIIR